MDDYLKTNRELWDAWTRINLKSKFYDVDGFKAGRIMLDSVAREGVGDVTGKSLLHLQCHFGLDTLSWARLGARVTGTDFSEEAIAAARALAKQVGLDAEFVCCNLYDLPQILCGEFDIVFTSHGVLTWLPDMTGWAKVIAHFLKPGGLFSVADAHPFARVFDDTAVTDFQVLYPYFHSGEPQQFEAYGSYADPEADYHGVQYEWAHSVGDIVNALIGAGLRIVEWHEYPYTAWQMLKFQVQDAEGWWRLPERFIQLPLMFSLKAAKM